MVIEPLTLCLCGHSFSQHGAVRFYPKRHQPCLYCKCDDFHTEVKIDG